MALNTDEKDLLALTGRRKRNWWSLEVQTKLGKKLGVPDVSSARMVGRAFQVGLFVPKPQVGEQVKKESAE